MRDLYNQRFDSQESQLKKGRSMPGSRPWGKYLPRLKERMSEGGYLLTTGGGAVVGGALPVLTGLGLIAATGPVGVAISVVGGVVGIAGLGTAMFLAIPPRALSAADCNAKILSIQELKELNPRILQLGVLGDTRAGKTTFIKRLLQKPPPTERTQGVHAYVGALQTTPVKYVALIDGGGEVFSDQFKVLNESDVLCIIIDHNISHDDKVVDHSRLEKTLDFQRQLRAALKNFEPAKPKPVVHILCNKSDLWLKLNKSDKAPLEKHFQAIEFEWNQSNLAKSVTLYHHSNKSADDMTTFLEILAGLAS